ncbi:hypothetical protein M422DRAFT_261238 [Sphaerobolus stellatus SS14]|uniref:Uncharacterized protein n=1 Tax=Sphaerobolus stellatus (strain SS14) TaxID=990650 RepID=A0A0C9UNT8_SPHS4|nr:hypothetical protein M422DRAFT_261238 [Sphaerobolus stellatus SS14]
MYVSKIPYGYITDILSRIEIIKEDLVGNIFLLLFDALVLITTTAFSWKESKQFLAVFSSRIRSLTIVFLRQSEYRQICYFFGTWKYRATVVPAFLRGVTTGIEISVSTILLSRFLLELRKFNTRSESIPAEEEEAVYDMGGRLCRINRSIIEDFGNPGFHSEWENATQSVEERESSDWHNNEVTELAVNAEEFPWAINGDDHIPSDSINSRR